MLGLTRAEAETIYPKDPNFTKYNVNRSFAYADTTLWLGVYIGVLATEFARLRKSGHNATPTKVELYHALRALERLDLRAEQFHYQHFRQGETVPSEFENYNGFLMRDDMTQWAYDRFKGIKAGNGYSYPKYVYSDSETSIIFQGYSFDAEGDPYDAKFSYEVSQDQMMYILMGLTLVRKYVPEKFTVDGYSLLKISQRISTRMIESRLHLNGLGRWALVNPATNTLAHIGEEACWASQELLIMHAYINKTTPIFSGCNIWSSLLGLAMLNLDWQATTMNDPWNRAMAMLLLSGSNVHGADTPAHLKQLERADQHTWHDAEEVFGLYHALLYNQPTPYSAFRLNKTLERLEGYSNDPLKVKEAKVNWSETNLPYLLYKNLLSLKEEGGAIDPMPGDFKQELSKQINRSSTVSIPW